MPVSSRTQTGQTTHLLYACVTGASRGFGRIWTEAALERGDSVIATARNPAALDDLAAQYGRSILAVPLDVTDRDAVFKAVRKGHEVFGRLYIVLTAAGYGYMGAVEELDPAEAKINFETNVFGTLSVIQAALPILRAQRSGHILTVSSIGGIMSFPTGGTYTASKWAVEAMTEALAGEVKPFGIKVTIIEPGQFATEFRANTKSAPQLAAYDPVRQAVRAAFVGTYGDPKSTASAILAAINADEPPLRLVLGSTTIPKFKAAYAARIANWEKWETVSNAAQGEPQA